VGLTTQPDGALAWWVTYDALDRDSPVFGVIHAVGPPGWHVAGADAPPEPPERVMPAWSPHTIDPATLSEWEGYGFGWFSTSIDPTLRVNAHIRAVSFPLWFPAAAFAAPPAGWVARRLYRRLRRPRPGACPRCGYDLRATPDRCPECGAEHRAAP
jgi:hypothetical protein